jgi:hypothetical protein
MEDFLAPVAEDRRTRRRERGSVALAKGEGSAMSRTLPMSRVVDAALAAVENASTEYSNWSNGLALWQGPE